METINEMCELTPPCECDCNPDKDLSQGNIRPNFAPASCGADSGVCGEHLLENPLRLWAVKYGVEGNLKFIGVAVIQAPNRCAAECIFAKNSLFSGTPERLKILAMKEITPWSEPVLFEDCAAIIDRRNLKTYPFLLRSEYNEKSQELSDTIIKSVEEFIGDITPYIDQTTGNWFVGGKDTGVHAQGDNGEDSFTPSVSVTKSGNTTTISVTDEQGTTSASIIDGSDGESAYQIWLDQGHTGTEEDFLNWLKEWDYLKQIKNLDTYEGEIDEIVQYKGETNSKYTNGYIYKKVGTQTIIPAGTEYINIGNRWTSYGFPECGIVPDIYYKTDKTDAISENIMKPSAWRYVTRSGGVNVYSDGADFKVRIGSIGVYWISGNENRFQIRQVESVSYSTYQDVSYPRSIRLTNGLGDDLQADTRRPIVPSFYLQSEITIFESLDGKKIYCYESNGQYYVLPLDFDGEHYQAIPYALVINDNNEYYIYGTTQESIDIDTTEWQQWDSQPREDTSHYVLDSDIGWIEH